MFEPEISVIVPCYNGATTLGLQLEALATQVGAPTFEVIVVDNASTDDLEGLLQQWSGQLPGLRAIRASSRQGVSYARNVGIGAARTEKLLFCDADDCVSAYWVAHGWENFRIYDLFSGSAISFPDADFAGSVALIREALGDKADFDPRYETQEGLSHPVLMGGDFGMTRTLALKLRGFDQSLPLAGEDNDLAIRAQRAGVPAVVSQCFWIAYRARADHRSTRRLAYRTAKAHALICARYGLWQKSPYVHGADWVIGPLRCLGAGMKMALSFKSWDWKGLTNRLAMNLGFTVGFVAFKLLKRIPPQDLGVGIEEGEAHRAVFSTQPGLA